MAKKQGMNIVEAHLEKIILAVAVALLGWVVYSQILSPSARLEVDGEKLKPSEGTAQAAKKADEYASQVSQDAPIDPAQDPPPLPDDIIKAFPVEKTVADAIPLAPPYVTDVREEIRGPYRIPDILALADVSVQLTHEQAYVPTVIEETDATAAAYPNPMGMGMMGMPTGGTNLQEVLSDVDFVTVEASIRIGEMRQRFDAAFGAGSRDPLVWASPAVAVVQLQRSRLMPDGDWGEFEDVGRLPVDPMADKAMSPADLDNLTSEMFEVRRNEWSVPDTQLLLLKPSPFRLLAGEWMSESERRAAKEGGDRNMGANPPQPGGAAPMMPGMYGGEGMMPGMPGPGYARGGMGTSKYSPETFMQAETISFWAHDAQVKPGDIYRYRIRLGFFNPVGGHPSWVEENQAALATQRVLWTDWNRPEQAVKIPERIFFVPRIAGAGQTVSVEVYRWQGGIWHNRRYSAVPGTVVGELTEERPANPNQPGGIRPTNPAESAAAQMIDYRTGAMILDVVPGVRYWYNIGKNLKDLVTTEVVYRDTEGIIRRLPVEKSAWPQEIQKLHSSVTRQIRDQEKEGAAPGVNPGGPGGMPVAPGMIPPGMAPGVF